MTKQKTYRIVIVGGGTGGHITPVLAVAEELSALGNYEIHFVGSYGGPENSLVTAAGYRFHPIQAGKLRRYLDWRNIIDIFRVAVGFLQAWLLLNWLRPAVVFAKGGYVSVPVVYAAAFLEIPIIVHESDVVMGLANRLAAGKAALVCTGFPVAAYPKQLQAKLRFTGNPVRQLFFAKQPSREALLKTYGLTAHLPVVLVMGGSQGAHTINQYIFDDLAQSLSQFQIIHLTGERDSELAQAQRAELPKTLQKHYLVYPFVGDELPALLTLADLVVARAGANTLSELALLGKPSILIPLPSAAGDHQRANAQVFAKKEAAVICEEADLDGPKLTAQIQALLSNAAERKRLSRAVKQFSSPKAAHIIAETISQIARR